MAITYARTSVDPTLDYRLITSVDVVDAPYSTQPVDGAELRNRIVFAKTRSGKFAKFHAWVTGQTLHLRDLTVYGENGFIERVSPPFTVRPSYGCDLENGAETASPTDLDFGWRAATATSVTLTCGQTGVALGPDFEHIGFHAVAANRTWSRGAIDGRHLSRQIVYVGNADYVAKALLDVQGTTLTFVRFTAWSRLGHVVADGANLHLPRPILIKPPLVVRPPFQTPTPEELAALTGLSWNGEKLTLARGTEVAYESYRAFAKYLPLLDDPTLRTAMAFDRPGGGAFANLGYDYWEEPLRRQLEEDIYLLETGRALPQTGPPPVSYNAPLDMQLIDWHDARNLYLAHVAQSLWVQATGAVRWKLPTDPLQLAYLFDSSLLMTRYANQYGFQVMGAVTSWNPQATFAYLHANGLIGVDAFDTVKKLTDWARANLVHFAGPAYDANGPFATVWDQMEWYYGYRGYPPVDLMLAPPPGKPHLTFGCIGTVGFYAGVLRAVNVPVRHGHTTFADGVHQRPEFISIGQNLAHADDPYDRMVGIGHHTPPIDLIFYTDAELAAKIDSPTPLPGKTVAETTTANQTRKFGDIAIQYMTDYLLGCRCYDLNHWGTPAPPTATWSRLWQALHDAYTDAELNTIAAQCDTATAALGGCAQIPPI